MIDAGDIHLADLNEQIRSRVLVVSIGRFHQLSDRVVVVPEIFGPVDEIADPWRIGVGGSVYGIDLVRSIPAHRLLERVDRAPAAEMMAVRRALRAIT